MAAEQWREVERLYHAACQRPPDERRSFLEKACGGDEALRREVESLLADDDVAANFLETRQTVTSGVHEFAPNSQLSHYRIGERLGAGGMAWCTRPPTLH